MTSSEDDSHTHGQSPDHCQGVAIDGPINPALPSPAPPSLPEVILSFDKTDLQTFQEVDLRTRQLNGRACPPYGYSLAAPLRMSYTETLIKEHLHETGTQVAAHSSYISMILSLVHLIIGSYELYLSWANEIPRWGYASYGLSVIPYLLMSACNLVCAAYVGSYPCGQLLRTPILEESLARKPVQDDLDQKPFYDGTIGTLKRVDSNIFGDERRNIRPDEYVPVKMHMESSTSGDSKSGQLVVTASLARSADAPAGWTKTWRIPIITAGQSSHTSLNDVSIPYSTHIPSQNQIPCHRATIRTGCRPQPRAICHRTSPSRYLRWPIKALPLMRISKVSKTRGYRPNLGYCLCLSLSSHSPCLTSSLTA